MTAAGLHRLDGQGSPRRLSRRAATARAVASLALLAAPALATRWGDQARVSPPQLRIGQAAGTLPPSLPLCLLQADPGLAARFPHTRLQWRDFDDDAAVLGAFAGGDLEFGFVAEAGLAAAPAREAVVVATQPLPASSLAVLVPADAQASDLSDLRGRRVAVRHGSAAHVGWRHAAAQAGLAPGEVTLLDLPPAQARRAFESGRVDAWAVTDPHHAAAEVELGARAIGQADAAAAPQGLYLASRFMAEQFPEALTRLFDALADQARWAEAHRPEAAERVARVGALRRSTAERLLDRLPAPPARRAPFPT